MRRCYVKVVWLQMDLMVGGSSHLIVSLGKKFHSIYSFHHPVLVVQRLDSAVHHINQYPLDNLIGDITVSFDVFLLFFSLAESSPRDLQITAYK